ncbi:PREDICTED: uncharacterized protein LOC108759613 [Trachymyrmex cornetzi]|uniref:uncharacterized protein LOC108759613 n=1 Tax=Trachymyrmex cornetzi TaxID=471704 RepID=UPI00084F3117|nr:PREDICTED: uncharacterized protein LOC108759613 [Trachymyrmex cornetzi]
MKLELMDNAPPGSIWACHPSRWIQTNIFTMWFDHFIKHTAPSATNPVLLVLDGHNSHIKNIEVIERAMNNFIHIVCLPPHSFHKMQPLDVGFMRPLKTYYAQEIENFLRFRIQEDRDTNKATVYRVAKLFTVAYNRSATMEISVNAFRKTGLYPLNRHIFQDYHFPVQPLNRDTQSIMNSAVNMPKEPMPEELMSEEPMPEEPMPGPSNAVSPFDIMSVPILRPTTLNRAGSACILTLSPYCNKLKNTLKSKSQVKGKQKENKKPTARRKLFSKKKSHETNNESSTDSDVHKDDILSDDDDTQCLFCNSSFKDDKHGETWVQCTVTPGVDANGHSLDTWGAAQIVLTGLNKLQVSLQADPEVGLASRVRAGFDDD